jgi:hypothetical protein
MVARIKPESEALVVVFERDGEEPVRVEAADGERAVLRAVTILLAPKAPRGRSPVDQGG